MTKPKWFNWNAVAVIISILIALAVIVSSHAVAMHRIDQLEEEAKKSNECMKKDHDILIKIQSDISYIKEAIDSIRGQ